MKSCPGLRLIKAFTNFLSFSPSLLSSLFAPNLDVHLRHTHAHIGGFYYIFCCPSWRVFWFLSHSHLVFYLRNALIACKGHGTVIPFWYGVLLLFFSYFKLSCGCEHGYRRFSDLDSMAQPPKPKGLHMACLLLLLFFFHVHSIPFFSFLLSLKGFLGFLLLS